MKAFRVWSEAEKPLPGTGSDKTRATLTEKDIANRNTPPEKEYEVVVKENLFWPNRSEHKTSTAPEKKPQKKPSGPDEKLLKLLKATSKRISLYGVLLTDKEKKALIASPAMPVLGKKRHPKRPPKGGQKIKWVEVGDPVNRFTVKDINPAGVVLGAEGLAFDIVLYDDGKPKQRATEKKRTGPTIIGLKDISQPERLPKKTEAPKTKPGQNKKAIEAGKKIPPASRQGAQPEKR